MMRVTVAICTWNRSALLGQTLTGMGRLVIPDGVEWELLVINNNSTDDTNEVISSHSGQLPLRVLQEPRSGKSNAANLALDAAAGELILWTDDDVLVEPDWLARCVEATNRHPDAAVFGGSIEPWFPERPDPELVAAFPALANGFCGLELGREEGPLPPESPIWGANMAFRRSATKGIRFDTTLGPSPKILESNGHKIEISVGGGEEVQFIRSVRERGGEVVWVPSMKVRHYVAPRRMTLDYLRALYAEYGRIMIRVNGEPEGDKLFGVPRWIVRKWIEAGLDTIYHRCRGSRVASLVRSRERAYYRGMLEECWAVGRDKTRAAPIAAPVPATASLG